MKLNLSKILAAAKKAATVAHTIAPWLALGLALAGKGKASDTANRVNDRLP